MCVGVTAAVERRWWWPWLARAASALAAADAGRRRQSVLVVQGGSCGRRGHDGWLRPGATTLSIRVKHPRDGEAGGVAACECYEGWLVLPFSSTVLLVWHRCGSRVRSCLVLVGGSMAVPWAKPSFFRYRWWLRRGRTTCWAEGVWWERDRRKPPLTLCRWQW
jgi:hypothetical protein